MRVKHREISLLIHRIRDAPAPGLRDRIEFRRTRAEIIGPTRFPARPIQPIGREGGQCPVTPAFGVLQGGGGCQAYP